jgi:hypothetical protein
MHLNTLLWMLPSITLLVIALEGLGTACLDLDSRWGQIGMTVATSCIFIEALRIFSKAGARRMPKEIRHRLAKS